MTQRQEKPQSQHIAKFSPKEPCNTAPGTAKGVWRDASRCNGRVSGAACFSLEGLSFYVWGLRVGYLFFSAAWLHRDLDNLHKWEGGLMTTKRGLGWGILKSCWTGLADREAKPSSTMFIPKSLFLWRRSCNMDTNSTAMASFPAHQVLSGFIVMHVNAQFIWLFQIEMVTDSSTLKVYSRIDYYCSRMKHLRRSGNDLDKHAKSPSTVELSEQKLIRQGNTGAMVWKGVSRNCQHCLNRSSYLLVTICVLKNQYVWFEIK